MEQRQVASAIAAGILELCADFTHRLSLPCHFDGSEAPAGMTRNALIAGFLHKREVALHVTGAASIPGYAAAVMSAGDRRRVDMLIVALERTVGCRMTTHTARIHYHLCGLGEKRARAADALFLPKTNNDTQLTATTEIVAERIPRLPRLSLSTRPVDRIGSAPCDCSVRSPDQRANQQRGPYRFAVQ
jgi:hypothetical protein